MAAVQHTPTHEQHDEHHASFTAALSNPWLRRAHHALEAATRGLTPAQLTMRADGEWSVSEELEHLALAYDSGVRKLREGAVEERPPARAVTLKQRVFAAVVLGAGWIPGNPQAPENVRPKGMPQHQALAEAYTALAALDELLVACEQRHGTRARVIEHYALGWMTTRQYARFQWVHTRAHLRQIARLLSSAGSGR